MIKRLHSIPMLLIVLYAVTAFGAAFDREDMQIKGALRTAGKAVGWADDIETYEALGSVVYMLMNDAGVISICAYPFESNAKTTAQSMNMGNPGTFHDMEAWTVIDPDGAASTLTWQGKRFIFSAATSDWQLEKTAEALYVGAVAEGLLPAPPGVEPDIEPPVVVVPEPESEPQVAVVEENITPPPEDTGVIEETDIVILPDAEEEPTKRPKAFIRLKPRVKFTSIDKSTTALNVVIVCRNIEEGSILRGELKMEHDGHSLQTVPAIVPDKGSMSFRFPAPFMGWTPGTYIVEIQMKDETLAKGTVTLP